MDWSTFPDTKKLMSDKKEPVRYVLKKLFVWQAQYRTECRKRQTAVLYTLADKFLDKAELDEIKEVIRMTRLGQMLMDEGMET